MDENKLNQGGGFWKDNVRDNIAVGRAIVVLMFD